jgi:hypothetical protein
MGEQVSGTGEEENLTTAGPRWTTVRVPSELRDRVKYLSDRYGKPQWKVLLEALALYETSLRTPRSKEELPTVDKVIWYMQKLSMSVGALKENPSDTNIAKTMKTIEQIRERLGVDTRILERAIRDYVAVARLEFSDPWDRHRVMDEATTELNMALKSVLIEVVYKHVLKEEGKLISRENQGSGEW